MFPELSGPDTFSIPIKDVVVPMDKPVIFRQQYKHLLSSLQKECSYLLKQQYDIDYDKAWTKLEHGIRLTEKNLKTQFSVDSKRFLAFSTKFKMFNFDMIDEKYTGYSVYNILKTLKNDTQQDIANTIASIFLVIKKTDKERMRIKALLDDAAKADENMSTEKMIEFKNKFISICKENANDYDALVKTIYNFITENSDRINAYIRLGISIVNEDLLPYINSEYIMNEETVKDIENILTNTDNTDFSAYIQQAINIAKSILTLIRALPKPKPSGKLKNFGEFIRALARFTKNKDLKQLLTEKNINSIEAFVEMIAHPITSGEAKNELYEIVNIFEKQNMNPIQLLRHIATTTEPIKIVKGMEIHKKPIRINTLDTSIWSDQFCQQVNNILTNPIEYTDNVDIINIIKDTWVYAKLDNLLCTYIKSINKQFDLNYSKEYLEDIIQLVEESF